MGRHKLLGLAGGSLSGVLRPHPNAEGIAQDAQPTGLVRLTPSILTNLLYENRATPRRRCGLGCYFSQRQANRASHKKSASYATI